MTTKKQEKKESYKLYYEAVIEVEVESDEIDKSNSDRFEDLTTEGINRLNKIFEGHDEKISNFERVSAVDSKGKEVYRY